MLHRYLLVHASRSCLNTFCTLPARTNYLDISYADLFFGSDTSSVRNKSIGVHACHGLDNMYNIYS